MHWLRLIEGRTFRDDSRTRVDRKDAVQMIVYSMCVGVAGREEKKGVKLSADHGDRNILPSLLLDSPDAAALHHSYDVMLHTIMYTFVE